MFADGGREIHAFVAASSLIMNHVWALAMTQSESNWVVLGYEVRC